MLPFMDSSSFLQHLVRDFPYQLTNSQEKLLKSLTDYLVSGSRDIFLLKGYAGTGKTTLISTLVNNLGHAGKNFVLLAPTGRASKVMSSYAGVPAYTLHKHLYYPSVDQLGRPQFSLKRNKAKNTLYIVDEASMISSQNKGEDLLNASSVLSDLIDFVYSGEGNQLILSGDKAQLPPVGTDLSPALDAEYLKKNFDKNVQEFELNEIVRQTLDSGILYNATKIRDLITGKAQGELKLDIYGFKDIIRLIDGYDIQDAIEFAYSGKGFEDTAIVVRSNKRANLYNQQIRSKVLLKESEIDAGDYLMVVKNNYFWLEKNAPAAFIANGDIIEILEIFDMEERYGFKFAKTKVRMLDYPAQAPFETVLLLDTLHSHSPSLTYAEQNKLYQKIYDELSGLPTKWQRYKKIKENPYFNALQVKFAYALTGHKSQGGQWDYVFVEQPYHFDARNKEDLRWLYTAFTRAKKKLFLIGFQDEYFE